MPCFFDCDMFSQYSNALPYPAVIASEPNSLYATLISGAYAGEGSETTAIAQYASHRYFTAAYPDVYEAYKYIAFVEMIHFSLLGDLIQRLGCAPLIGSYETNQYWNGSFPAYQYAPKDILEADIEGEHAAIAHYNRLISQIDDPSFQALFARIILDEEKHIEVLSRLYQTH